MVVTRRTHAMSGIASVPDETLAHIFGELDLVSLLECEGVSRKWNRVANDDQIWRKVAIRHCWASPHHNAIGDVTRDISPEQAITVRRSRITLESPRDEDEKVAGSSSSTSTATAGPCPLQVTEAHGKAHLLAPLLYTTGANDYYKGLESFKDLCKRGFCLAEMWACKDRDAEPDKGDELPVQGHLSPICKQRQLRPIMRNVDARPHSLSNMPVPPGEGQFRDVWRIKICPKEKMLLSTGRQGGVSAVHLETGEVIWQIPSHWTRACMHIEYDRGYAVMDATGAGEFDVYLSSQLYDGADADLFANMQYFATLNTGHPTRALRFQFPLLAVATQDGVVVLVDVTTQKVVQKISLAQSLHVRGNINYIEFDDDFVFLVGNGVTSVSVISRKLGKVIWTLAEHFRHGLSRPAVFGVVSEPEHPSEHIALDRRRVAFSYTSTLVEELYVQSRSSQQWSGYEWVAVHPDLRTNTLVILGQFDILLIRDYAVLFSAWERRLEGGRALTDRKIGADEQVADLEPAMFANITDHDPLKPLNETERFTQLAVADGRVFVTSDCPTLIDLDPFRLGRQDPGFIPSTPRYSFKEDHGEVLTQDAGFALYRTIEPMYTMNPNVGIRLDSALVDSSCAQMDGGAIYAVQWHIYHGVGPDIAAIEALEGVDPPEEQIFFTVAVYDFANRAKQEWSKDLLPLAESSLWPEKPNY